MNESVEVVIVAAERVREGLVSDTIRLRAEPCGCEGTLIYKLPVLCAQGG